MRFWKERRRHSRGWFGVSSIFQLNLLKLMKIQLFKFIYDTDSGTGCDVFPDRESALDRLFSCAKSWGYEGERDEDAIADWQSGRVEDIDTYFIEPCEVEVGVSVKVHHLALDTAGDGTETYAFSTERECFEMLIEKVIDEEDREEAEVLLEAEDYSGLEVFLQENVSDPAFSTWAMEETEIPASAPDLAVTR